MSTSHSSDNNITLTETPSPVQAQQPQQRLVDVEIVDQNVALNVIVSFLNLAQRRGAFTMDESAKILECIKKFQ
jgi:glutathione synthase/RimK-type ligase-like ATP-grasp enzyme